MDRIEQFERGLQPFGNVERQLSDQLCVEILHSLARAYDWPDHYHYLDNQ